MLEGSQDLQHAHHQRPVDREVLNDLVGLWTSTAGSTLDKLRNPSKFIPRSDFLRLLVFHDLFKLILDVPGAILECGVHLGGGLMTWAQLSAAYEPINHTRRVVGFDTFSGFADIAVQDLAEHNAQSVVGGLAAPILADLHETIAVYDKTRPINHIPRVLLVPGDATTTMPDFLKQNPHSLVALLHLDFDVYRPTRVALETFIERMPRGAVIVFDELNDPHWPGETLALLDTIGIKNLNIRRFPHQPQITYAIID